MKGAELGLEDEENRLYKEIDNISNDLLNKFKLLRVKDLNIGSLNGNILDKTKTIFTTPQIIFNVQELDKDRLEQCFNYVNKKFGSQY